MPTIFIPEKREKYGKRIWEHNNFSVYARSGCLDLFLRDLRIGSIYSSDDISETKYKTYENWVRSIRRKDMDKIERTKEMINDLLAECDALNSIWDGN